MRKQPLSDFCEGIRAVLVDKAGSLERLRCLAGSEACMATSIPRRGDCSAGGGVLSELAIQPPPRRPRNLKSARAPELKAEPLAQGRCEMIRLCALLGLLGLVVATDEKGLAFLKQKEAEEGVMKRPSGLLYKAPRAFCLFFGLKRLSARCSGRAMARTIPPRPRHANATTRGRRGLPTIRR